jgi:hypothetical protein
VESEQSPAAAGADMGTTESAYTALWAPFDPSARIAAPRASQVEAASSVAVAHTRARAAGVTFNVPAAEAVGVDARSHMRSRATISGFASGSDEAAATSTSTATAGSRAGALALYGAEAAVLSGREVAAGHPSGGGKHTASEPKTRRL